MNKIICVYQDCFMCGSKGKKIQKFIAESDIDIAIKKISFASPEGKKLCSEAVLKHGIKTMPFFTDGKKFTNTLEELLAKPKKTTKKTRKTIKKKEVKDEFDS